MKEEITGNEIPDLFQETQAHLNPSPSHSPPRGEERMNCLFFSPPLEGLGEAWKEEKIKPGYMTADPSIYKKIKEIQIYQKQYPAKAESLIWGDPL